MNSSNSSYTTPFFIIIVVFLFLLLAAFYGVYVLMCHFSNFIENKPDDGGVINSLAEIGRSLSLSTQSDHTYRFFLGLGFIIITCAALRFTYNMVRSIMFDILNILTQYIKLNKSNKNYD